MCIIDDTIVFSNIISKSLCNTRPRLMKMIRKEIFIGTRFVP